ncbi:ATP-grasp fold amidoligase family protein [Ornithinimicrobium panacihumi]|uniref:ATP-grasp fold amidoligase family protein n=1 Tax=Ornithinimicrobium panacihumi TaxID=2008449 RepID=UPI003F8B2F01
MFSLGDKSAGVTWYDGEGSYLPWTELRLPRGVARSFPGTWSRLAETAELLGAGLDHIRVDLYEVDGIPIFGELTAYPAGGLRGVTGQVDELLGELWRLPDLSAT